MLLEGEHLVFVHDEGGVAPTAARLENHPQGFGRVLPDAQLGPEDVGLVHLEHRRRRRERSVGLGDGWFGGHTAHRNSGREARAYASLEGMPTDESLVPTERATVRRRRERGSHDRALVNRVLDEGLVCDVGFAGERGPVVLPMTYVRIGDQLYLHGAAGNDMLRNLAGDAEVCVTVTLLDGLVFARSAFHHSMNYRCVVLFGRAERVTDEAELLSMAAALLDHLAPGRSNDARRPTAEELRATLIIRLRITEGSAKVRTGGPLDDEDDLDLPVWAGEVPMRLVAQVTDSRRGRTPAARRSRVRQPARGAVTRFTRSQRACPELARKPDRVVYVCADLVWC